MINLKRKAGKARTLMLRPLHAVEVFTNAFYAESDTQ
jgi:hypothetical protein